MESFLKFMYDNQAIFLYAAIVLLIFFLERTRAERILYNLMLQARRLATQAILRGGQEEEDWVVKQAKRFLPIWVRIFLPDDRLREFVKILFQLGKDYLDDGQFNGTNGKKCK